MTQEEFDALYRRLGPKGLEVEGWEYCHGEVPEVPCISHPECNGGWELWKLTDRGARSMAYAGEAVLLEGPFGPSPGLTAPKTQE